MSMPRLDYQRPDYTDRISGGLSALGKEVEANSPAPEIVQKYLRMAMSGRMSPQEAARRAQAEHHLSMNGSGMGTPPQPQAPQAPSPGPWQGGLGAGPSIPTSGGFTGPREFTSEETVMAPSPSMPAQAPQALDAMPEDNLPIRNRDVPTLIQVGGMSNKGQGNDIALLNYLERQRQFNEQQPFRLTRQEATKAQTANIPFKNKMAQGNLGARWAGVDVAKGNLNAREAGMYLGGTKGTALPIAQIENLLQAAETIPDVTPSAGDYAARQAQGIAEGVPIVGKALGSAIGTIADYNLTPEQREWRRQVQTMIAPYRHAMVGSQVTGDERRWIDMILGQQTNIQDTKKALASLLSSMRADKTRWDRAFPGVATTVGRPDPQTAFPPRESPYPSGFEGRGSVNQPGPEGPSLDDELNSLDNPLRNR